MKKRFLKNKETRELAEKLSSLFGFSLDKKGSVHEAEIDGKKIIFSGDVPLVFLADDRLVPTLKSRIVLPGVKVDKGAVKFISSGADVMRPGIVGMDEFNEGDIVYVADSEHGVNLAVGEALASSEEIEKMEKGKVVKSLHYVGDKVWGFINES